MLNMNNYIKNDTQNDLLQLLYKEFKRGKYRYYI